eukprot:3606314-Pleurochrysis_carterae.AAC.1
MPEPGVLSKYVYYGTLPGVSTVRAGGNTQFSTRYLTGWVWEYSGAGLGTPEAVFCPGAQGTAMSAMR